MQAISLLALLLLVAQLLCMDAEKTVSKETPDLLKCYKKWVLDMYIYIYIYYFHIFLVIAEYDTKVISESFVLCLKNSPLAADEHHKVHPRSPRRGLG